MTFENSYSTPNLHWRASSSYFFQSLKTVANSSSGSLRLQSRWASGLAEEAVPQVRVVEAQIQELRPEPIPLRSPLQRAAVSASQPPRPKWQLRSIESGNL
jgi:hypothetical protein